MTIVLVVDDLITERLLAGGLLQKMPEFQVLFAKDGEDALRQARKTIPDIILTDLIMPGMNGLQLVEAVKKEFPLIPVILMTSRGSDDVAVQALQLGAASYVSKAHMNQTLVETIRRVLVVSREQLHHSQLLHCFRQTSFTCVLENDLPLLQALVGHIQSILRDHQLFAETERVRIGVALEEALMNALYHGNLECSSKLREENYAYFYELAAQRLQEDPYRQRSLTVSMSTTPDAVEFVVADQGPGFDHRSLPDPRDPDNLERPCGRGVFLMRTFFDEVHYNDVGNQVRLIKARPNPNHV